MQCFFLFACIVTAFSSARAWAGYDENHFYGGWPLSRRNSYRCRLEGEDCNQSLQCCDEDNICFTEHDYDSTKDVADVGICINARHLQKSANPYKFQGDRCRDSTECFDMCCRAKRRHRMGIAYVCDEIHGPHTCIRDVKAGKP